MNRRFSKIKIKHFGRSSDSVLLPIFTHGAPQTFPRSPFHHPPYHSYAIAEPICECSARFQEIEERRSPFFFPPDLEIEIEVDFGANLQHCALNKKQPINPCSPPPYLMKRIQLQKPLPRVLHQNHLAAGLPPRETTRAPPPHKVFLSSRQISSRDNLCCGVQQG